MKTASLAELRKELSTLSPEDVQALCVRMAGYKKENKELLSYLLFEAHDEEGYIGRVKEEIRGVFDEINKTSLYLAKKTVRRILRILNKHIKYTGSRQVEVELLIFFCQELKNTKLRISESEVLVNLYRRQLAAIDKALDSLHEDLQYDYDLQLTSLEEWIK